MSAPLPGNFILPADRELARLERLVADLPAAERAEKVLRMEAARHALRVGMSELATLPIAKGSLDDWSRRTFRSFAEVFFDVIGQLAKPEVIEGLRVDLEKQRGELRAFLSPLHIDAQADWALVATQLSLDAFTPHVLNAKLPSRQELESQLAGLDFAGPIGASLRVVCFLTFVLEAARAKEALTTRHAALVGLAFVDAVTMVTAISRETGVSLDPTPYLLESRGLAARAALLRLLGLPRDEAFNSFLEASVRR